jgi:hypothetical protein
MVRRPGQNDNGNGVVQENNNDKSHPEHGLAGASAAPMSLPLAGGVPSHEWARRVCFVRMISMNPGSIGSSRYVLGDAFMTIATKNDQIDPARLVALRRRGGI